MQCRKCRTEISEEFLFCPHCGARQQTESRKRLKRPNGFGTVYKKSGRRSRPWVAAKDGQYIGFYATKTDALEALEKLSGKTVQDTYNYTFKQVFTAWKAEYYPNVGSSGQAQYERAFTVFADLHDRKYRDLRTADFQEILDRHKSKAESTVDKYKQLLTQMGTWAIKNEIVTTSFASFCRVSGRKAVHHEPMTDAEIKLLEKEAALDETAKIVCMLLATGMRIGELFALPLEDYHETYVIGGEKTEAGRNRIIPIRPEGRKHFAYFARQADTLLLDGYVGNQDAHNFRNRDYYNLLDRLGIPHKSPHSTRVTYGTRAAVTDELAPAALQKVLGHASFNTTQKYYNQPDAATLVEAVERAGKKKKRKTA